MASVYNKLPSVDAARDAFTDRDAMFERLMPLLLLYGLEYGVTLVHSHTTLADNETMLSDPTGTRTSPVSDVQEAYGDRWLPSGEAYEFRRKFVPPPPPEFMKAFREIVGDDSSLGVCYAKDYVEGTVAVEITIGRENIVEWVDAQCFVHDPTSYIETAWLVDGNGPITKVFCMQACRWSQSEKRHASYHTTGGSKLAS